MNKRIFYLLSASLLLLVANSPARAETNEAPSFDIWEYRVEGNSLLDTAAIESALYPYLGTGKNIETVESARDFLQQLYKQKGYPIVVVKIPEQNVIGGIVKLQVIEGRIHRTKISGNQYFSRRAMRDEVPSLAQGQPLNMVAVRNEIDDLNRLNSYRQVTPVITISMTRISEKSKFIYLSPREALPEMPLAVSPLCRPASFVAFLLFVFPEAYAYASHRHRNISPLRFFSTP